jgi:hypothetical protein
MKKHHWHAFRHEKLFEKTTLPNLLSIPIKHMDEITNVQVDKICNHTLN